MTVTLVRFSRKDPSTRLTKILHLVPITYVKAVLYIFSSFFINTCPITLKRMAHDNTKGSIDAINQNTPFSFQYVAV